MGSALLLAIGLTFSISSANAPEDQFFDEAAILNPGMAISCQNDFIIENIDNSEAEYLMMIGNEKFINEKINANEAKAYGLAHSINQAKSAGKLVDADDVAIVFNLGVQSKLKIHCME